MWGWPFSERSPPPYNQKGGVKEMYGTTKLLSIAEMVEARRMETLEGIEERLEYEIQKLHERGFSSDFELGKYTAYMRLKLYVELQKNNKGGGK